MISAAHLGGTGVCDDRSLTPSLSRREGGPRVTVTHVCRVLFLFLPDGGQSSRFSRSLRTGPLSRRERVRVRDGPDSP